MASGVALARMKFTYSSFKLSVVTVLVIGCHDK